MAQAICELDLITEQASGLVALTEEAAEKQPKEIQEFYKYMYEVREIAAIVENGPEKKKARYGEQSGGKRVQDALVMSEITRDQLDFSNCANCKHNYVLPIGHTQIEINVHNENQKISFRKKMMEYNTRTKSRRGDRKPKMGRMMSRRLACLCTRMNCLNRTNGVGCMKCEWVCLEFKKANRKSRPYFDSNSDCKCLICACQCSVVYFCSEEKKLAQQAREDKLAELDTKPQSQIDSFYGFSNAIAGMAMKRIKENKDVSPSCLLGLASEDILQSIKLQQDVDLRNTLQKSIGAISDHKFYSDDGKEKSLAQLRKENRLPWQKNVNMVNLHLPIENTKSNLLTPTLSSMNSKNSRWHNNKLSATPIDLISDITSESSTKEEEDPSNKLHKAVMKRLISVDSPPSKKKSICFRKMAKGDIEVKTVIDLATEMNSSVEATTNMVLNNCSDE